MRIRLNTAMALAALMLFLSACNLPQKPEADLQPAPQGKLQAWVDAPLNGSRLPVNVAYPVVCHGADPSGVTAVDFSVNSAAAGIFTAAAADPMLLTANFSWLPTAPGRFMLECRAQNTSGIWSEPAQAMVIIEGVTPTFTPTPSLTPTLTVTPTPTETATLTPSPVPQFGFAGPPVFNPVQINLPYDCTPSWLTAEIEVTSTKGIQAVVLFYRVADKDFSDHSEWASIAMRPAGGNKYQVKFEPIKNGGLMPWLSSHWSTGWQGWLSTQFVIQDTNGGYTRSDVYNKVAIGGCH